MSILFSKPAAEERSLSFADVWGSGGTPGASKVNALSIVPVYAATSYIADQFAASPLAVFDKSDSGVPVRAKDQPDLVRDPGVNGLDVYSWKHQAIASALLRGNAYGYILTWDRRGVPSKVVWLNPTDCEIDENGPVPVYTYQGNTIPRDRLIHVPAYVQAGSVKGLSPLALFKSQLETAEAAQSYGRTWFKRGGVPSGILRNTKKTLTPQEAQSTRSRFKVSVSASDPFVTGADWDYTAIAVPGSEVAFVSALKLTASQVASIYRVAPEDVGGEVSGQSLTYKNLEQDQIRFAVRTMRPWTTRFEAVLDRYLFGTQYVKFNLDASARADLAARMNAHKVAIDAGVETIDEARALEERAPLTPDQWSQYLAIRNKAPQTPGGTDDA